MRKIVFLMHVSLDGYVNDANGGMDWIVYNSAVAQISNDLNKQMDTAIYGRATYEMMAGYWPNVLNNSDADERDLKHAEWVNTATKIAVSTTLESVDWQNTRIIGKNLEQEIIDLKQQPGKNIWLLGSPTLAQSLMKLGLIDEYILNVNPVILGSGKALFGELEGKINLKLLESRALEGGVVTLRYAPASD